MMSKDLLRAAESVVLRYHDDFLARDQEPGRPHPRDIGTKAESIMVLWHSAQFSPSRQEQCALAGVVGTLLYAAHYGLSFDEINDQFGLEIASLVSKLSPDLRLPCVRRHHLLVSDIASVGPVGQSVVLAESVLWGKELLARVKSATFRRRNAQFIRFWRQRTANSLSVLRDLRRDAVTPIFDEADQYLFAIKDAMPSK